MVVRTLEHGEEKIPDVGVRQRETVASVWEMEVKSKTKVGA